MCASVCEHTALHSPPRLGVGHSNNTQMHVECPMVDPLLPNVATPPTWSGSGLDAASVSLSRSLFLLPGLVAAVTWPIDHKRTNPPLLRYQSETNTKSPAGHSLPALRVCLQSLKSLTASTQSPPALYKSLTHQAALPQVLLLPVRLSTSLHLICRPQGHRTAWYLI